MKPTEIAEAYIKYRYGLTGESDLEEEILGMVKRGVIRGPVSLVWKIFEVETLLVKKEGGLAVYALCASRQFWQITQIER